MEGGAHPTDTWTEGVVPQSPPPSNALRMHSSCLSGVTHAPPASLPFFFLNLFPSTSQLHIHICHRIIQYEEALREEDNCPIWLIFLTSLKHQFLGGENQSRNPQSCFSEPRSECWTLPLEHFSFSRGWPRPSLTNGQCITAVPCSELESKSLNMKAEAVSRGASKSLSSIHEQFKHMMDKTSIHYINKCLFPLEISLVF